MITTRIGAVFTLLLAFSSQAQIRFEHTTLAEAVIKAKKEHKPLFVDVYAEWCGPCKRMAATAFVDPALSEFYNKHFINVKIDGEKGDGPAIMQQYGITAFPTLLYLDADANLTRKMVGMMDVSGLTQRGNEAIHPETTPIYIARKQYYASQLTDADMRTYISAMIADQSDSLSMFTQAYYNVHTNLDMADEIDFYVFYQHENDITKPNSVHFLENPAEYPVEVYTGKIKAWVNFAFSQAVGKGDFAIIESMIDRVYPYWEKAEALGQDKATYITYVRSQYNRYHPG